MSDFRAAAEAAHRAGFTYFDQLGGREVPGGIELWLRVLDPATLESRVIKTEVSVIDDSTSVADLWSGAKWAERDLTADDRRTAALLMPNGGFAHPGEGR